MRRILSIFTCLFLLFSSIKGQTVSEAAWTCLGPFNMETQNIGFVSSFSVHPSGTLAYAGALHGGLWLGRKCMADTCSHPGWNWVNITDSYKMPGLGVNAFEIADRGNGQQRIYVATQFGGNGRNFGYSNGILCSDDGGKSWKQVGPPVKLSDYQTVNYLKMNKEDNNIMFADISKKLFYTTDGWETWKELVSPIKNQDRRTEIGDIEWKPGDKKTFYLTTRSEFGIKSEFYVTRDGGQTFSDMKPAIVASNIQLDVWRKPGKENCIFMAYGDPSMSVQYFDGTKWSGKLNKKNVSHFAGSPYWNMEFDVNDLDTSVMYLSTTQLSRSTDGGKTFTAVSEYWGKNSHADIRDMQILKSSVGGTKDVIGMGNDGGISLSESDSSGLPVWTNINGYGLCIAQLWGLGTCEAEPDYIVAGGQDNGIYSFRNNTWKAQALGVGDGYDGVISELNTTYALGEGNSPTIVQSVDGGNSWSGTSTPAGPANIFKRPLFYEKNANTAWLGHHQLWMKNNSDGKFSAPWIQKSFLPDYKGKSGTLMNLHINCFAIGGKNNSVGFMAYNGPCWGNDSIQGKAFVTLSLDKEKPDWIDISRFIRMLDWREINDAFIDPNDSKKIYIHLASPVAGFDREIYQLDILNGGDSVAFTDITYNLPKVPGSKLVMETGSQGNLYFATDSGVYFTNYQLLNEKRWVLYKEPQSNFPFCNISDMEINYASNSLIVATYGRGVWKTPLAATGTDKTQVIRRSTVWNKKKKVDGMLVVNAYKTLTITAEVFVSAQSQIILKKSAKLVIRQNSRKPVLLDYSGKRYDDSKVQKGKYAKISYISG